jgi:NAD+ synthase (glutamine-hydrolysing)
VSLVGAKNIANVIRIAGFDMRPFLYPSRFPWQFRKIDDVAALLPDRSNVELEQKTKTD